MDNNKENKPPFILINVTHRWREERPHKQIQQLIDKVPCKANPGSKRFQLEQSRGTCSSGLPPDPAASAVLAYIVSLNKIHGIKAVNNAELVIYTYIILLKQKIN